MIFVEYAMYAIYAGDEVLIWSNPYAPYGVLTSKWHLILSQKPYHSFQTS